MHIRHGARVNAGLSLQVIQTARRHLGGDIETSLIFAAILAGNAAPLDENPGLARTFATGPVPDDLRRPMRIQRLAESLNLPRETTRSKAAAMVAAGLVEQTGQGLIVPSSTLASGPMMSLVNEMMTALDNSLHRVAVANWTGLQPGERLAPRPFPTMWGAMRALTQHVLRSVVDLRGDVPPMSLLQAYLLLAVSDRSAHLLSDADPVLFANHDDVPPDSALDLVTAQGLATFLGFPRETVRRNMHELVRLGALVRKPGGYAISAAVRRAGSSGEKQMQENVRINLVRLVRKLRNIDAIAAPSHT